MAQIKSPRTLTAYRFKVDFLFAITNLLKRLVIAFVLLPFWGLGGVCFAHPMPNSMVVLNVHQKHYTGQMQLPLAELQSAIGMSVNDNSEKLIERLGDTLRIYLTRHIQPKSFEGKPWSVVIGAMKVLESKSPLTGDYKELVIDFEMTPPPSYDLRNFYFDYDVILHQVASHKALIVIKQDWQQGIVAEDTTTQQVGVIAWDIETNTLKPFQISLAQGSTWQGFKNMVSLGISHIKEGTDHILFILTLLLAVSSLTSSGRVTTNGKRSLWEIGGLITAFTVGHSLTLFLGSVQWITLPVQPIEILIAVTILVSAFHAFRPIYPKKEILVAGAFGLIHGMAFAETLTNLQLSTKQMILSILGFNIGIELMQLVIIAVAFPILFLLSKTRYYTIFRQVGAVLIMILAFAWLIERIQDKPNFITQ
jgi:hydrogenase/urease accessory protein HupE